MVVPSVAGLAIGFGLALTLGLGDRRDAASSPTNHEAAPDPGLYQQLLGEDEVVRFADGPVVISSVTVHNGQIALDDGPEGFPTRSFRFEAGAGTQFSRSMPHTYPIGVRFEGPVFVRPIGGPSRVTIVFTPSRAGRE